MSRAPRIPRTLAALAIVAASLAGDLAATPPAQAAPANSCSDPYWEHSLRCQKFPADPPQPNIGVGPASVAELGPFTRVFLSRNAKVRSFDGTIPVMYVDKAVCTQSPQCPDGTPFGQPVVSHDWVISFEGGGSCAVEESETAGVFDDPTACLAEYANPIERDEMGTATKPAMRNLLGINYHDPAVNGVFAGYNRVRIDKSSYDRFLGRVGFASDTGYFEVTAGSQTLDFNVYQHGNRIIREALRMLASGLRYTTWEDSGGQVAADTERLPPLSQAQRVLFVGHSGGAHGLYHNIDQLASVLPWADVRALFDANFVESPENEAAFATDWTGVDLIGGDAYSQVWEGESVGATAPFPYDGEDFARHGGISTQMRSWNAQRDESCLDAHPADEEWMCADRGHVLFNHISTPFFVRQDMTDPNPEHTNHGTGHPVIWGDVGVYSTCPDPDPCMPTFSMSEHNARMMEQATRLIDDSSTRSELATGDDVSMSGIGAFPAFSMWMPNCTSHNGAYSMLPFFQTSMDHAGTTVFMSDSVAQFMAGPRIGPPTWLVDGFVDAGGNAMTTVTCS